MDREASLRNWVRSLRALGRDRRAAVTTEYVIVVGTVTLVAAGALAGVGPKLVAASQLACGVLLQPYP